MPLLKKANYNQTEAIAVSNQAKPVISNEKKIEPISRQDDNLKNLISEKISEFKNSSWSVYVYDLKNDKTASVNATETMDAASLYKLFLLESLDQKLPYERWQYTWLTSQSISVCVDAMLQESDDPCAEDLSKYLDLNKVDAYNKKNGYKNTVFSDHFGGKQTTAEDVGKLFVNLKKGEILSDYARRYVFDALYQQQLNKGIAKGCGDCRTANKQGELSNVAYDAGVITHGKRSYVLVAMTKGGNFKDITNLTKEIDAYLVDQARSR